ncbi:unnamed protein product, partial [Meganyctiphanes norvegica]
LFQDVTEVFHLLVEEMLNFSNNFITRSMNCKFVQMIITYFKNFMKANPIIEIVYAAVVEVFNKTLMALKDDLAMFYKKLMNFPMIKKIVDFILEIFHSKKISMELISWKSFTTGVHLFVTEVLGMTYTIAGNHFTTVVALPCSVSTLNNVWTSATTYLSAVVADIMNTWLAVTETFPVTVTTFKKYVSVNAEIIFEQIPIIVKFVKTQVPKFINELIPTINNFIEFLMNTEVFRFLMFKIEKVITMFPAEFNAIKEFVEMFIEYTFFVCNKIMESPIFMKIVDYIRQLVNRKDLYSLMVSSMSYVSNNVSNYTTSIFSNVSTFIRCNCTPKCNCTPCHICNIRKLIE